MAPKNTERAKWTIGRACLQSFFFFLESERASVWEWREGGDGKCLSDCALGVGKERQGSEIISNTFTERLVYCNVGFKK